MPKREVPLELVSNKKKRKSIVYARCFDDVDNLVALDPDLLRSWNCQLSKKLDYDEPEYYTLNSEPVYHLNFSRATLVAFLKSLMWSQFIIPPGMSYEEAVSMFHFQGIGVPGFDVINDPKLQCPSQLHPQSQPMAHDHDPDGPNIKHIEAIAMQVVMAILEWPRVCIALKDAARGLKVSNATCNSTSFFVRFASKPAQLRAPIPRDANVHSKDDLFYTVKKEFGWMRRTLESIGYLHYELKKKKMHDDTTPIKTLKLLLKDEMKKHPLGGFLSVKHDMPRLHRDKNKEALDHATKFASDITRSIVKHGDADEMIMLNDGTKRRRGVGGDFEKFARAIVTLAFAAVDDAPCLDQFFCDHVADDKGVTIERKTFNKALKQHGLCVRQWKAAAVGVTPFIFPPAYKSGENYCTGSGGKEAPILLIERSRGIFDV
tara:strand:- start:106 stop:1401 length:1296 start_codon:yes stop_codon:yes gene_type:complete